ncbi:uncharacterized protein LOC124366148 [Homalodisca vitripennis]|uniref:uncharacterized protein LOC124366148 n=1 Tax=Homalodisca vitripennis TaxID=197043 RepID=UPI001EEC9DB1|nr:uncharacterized protein LOC124366148 [Homalodisca vitripennis]KAG8311379.1 hypothetical protein J6590_044526 [Homalodisca vitripennis]
MNIKQSIQVFHKEGSKMANTNTESPKHSTVPSTPDPVAPQLTTGHNLKNVNPLSFKTDTTPMTSKTKKSLRLSDLMSAMYPGLKIGHKYCIQKPMLVPKTMGWLWNTEDTATGVPFPRGYRPGAIALGVKKGKMLRPRISEPSNTPVGAKGRKIRRKIKTASSTVLQSQPPSLEISTKEDRPPTLYIRKEGGIYRVVMQPIKDPGAEDNEEEEEQPVQFKIAEDSADSSSRHSKSSSSSLKIEYVCTGALRKPTVKPALTEMGVQYDTADLAKKEPERHVKIKEAVKKMAEKKDKKEKK